MKRGVIVNGGTYVKFHDDDKIYPISKHHKNHGLTDGELFLAKIDNEYPESCDNNPFCEGDETCIICLHSNKVAIL
jgi:hypothetical protein